MSLHLRSGRLTIDQSGVTKFDSDDKLYHNITTGLIGSFTAPTRSVSGGRTININTDHLIGTCNPFCTHVVGSVRFTGTVHAFPADVWFSYEGGSLFWIIDYHTGIQNPTYAGYPCGIVKYRIFTSGGNVYLNERVAFTSNVTLIIPTHAVYWRLKAGRFT